MLDSNLALYAETEPKINLERWLEARNLFHRMTEQLRANGFWAKHESGIRIEECSITGLDGNSLQVRVYRKEGLTKPAPAVIFFHGGGHVLGDLDLEHNRCLGISKHADVVVVATDYRLAPEFPFPAAVNDCYSTLVWVAHFAQTIGVDRQRVIVAGASCGGGLAAAVALMARDKAGPIVLFQSLLYPVLDDRMNSPSMIRFLDTSGWNRSNTKHMWRHYLGNSRLNVSPYAAPLRATILAGLPPAYILTAELDPLRDEGMEYRRRLLEVGVSVELHQMAGT